MSPGAGAFAFLENPMTATLAAPACKNCGTELTLNRFGKAPTYCSIRCKRRDQRSASEREAFCATCQKTFTTRRPEAKYCSPACREPNARRCGEHGCENPHRARGLCAIHWKQQHGTRAKALTPCTVCGTEVIKDADSKRNAVCSYACRRYLRFSEWPSATVPDTHPVLSSRIPDDHPSRMSWKAKTYKIYIPDCRWCGKTFVTQQPHHALCSKRCTRHESRTRRKAREHGALGTYTWTEVVSLYIKFGRTCAYCRKPVSADLNPDHVVPLARGGSNSISNILPACHRCNGDKRDLLVGEWIEDRKRRNLPSLPGTSWLRGDPLYSHLGLTDAELARV